MTAFHRIVAIARVTLVEALRQKVLLILIFFGLIAIGTSFLFANLTLEEEFKFIKDFCTGAISFFGLFIAIIGTAQLLPSELENRTIYTILAKPVRRSEFLLGKYFGILFLLFVTVAFMSALFFGVLIVKEQSMIAAENATLASLGPGYAEQAEIAIARIQEEASDPRLVQAVLLIFARLALVAAITLLVSTFATSLIFTAVTSFMLYVIGHLQSIARDVWLHPGQDTSWFTSVFLGTLSLLIPDMNAYAIIDEIVAGNAVAWSFTLNVLAYSAVYIVVYLAAACLIFGEREL